MPKTDVLVGGRRCLGAGSSLWAERKVRRTVQAATAKLQPDALVAEVGRSARQVAGSAGERVREAVSSGRDEMQRHEEELWADLAAQGVEPHALPAPGRRRRRRAGRDRPRLSGGNRGRSRRARPILTWPSRIRRS